MFFEIGTNFFGNVVLVCFLHFYSNFACFVICKNYFLFSIWFENLCCLELFLCVCVCFCFKNLHLLDQQTTPFYFSLSILFVIFTSCGLKLLVLTLHSEQYVVPSSFPVFIGFIFDRVFFRSYIIGNIFLTIHFKQSAFIEWFELNYDSSNLFERL